MDPLHMSTREAIIVFALVNAAIGLVLGLIPLLFGYFNKRLRLGVIGFFTALVGGAILGIFLSIPATIVFTWLVVRKEKAPVEVNIVNSEPIDVSVRSIEDTEN
ncbi:MAG: hypothetical protein ABJA02_12310 [Acidobacteriota bacterium]